MGSGMPKTIEEFLAEKYGQGSPEIAPYVASVDDPNAAQPPLINRVPSESPTHQPKPQATVSDDYPYYNDPESMNRAQDLASSRSLTSAIGSGVQDIIKGGTGFQSSDDYFKRLAESSKEPIAQENARQGNVREYLKNKYESGIKKQELEKGNRLLEETLRHNRATEGLDAAKINASLGSEALKTQTPFGKMGTEDDAKKAKDVVTAYDSYTKKLDRLKELRQKYDGELYGPVKAEMDSLGASAIVDFKNMATLGALSAGDLGLVNDAIGDVASHGTLTSSAIAKLETARKNADEQIRSFAKGHGGNADSVITSPAVRDPLSSGVGYSDPDKEKRYQQWKASQGAK